MLTILEHNRYTLTYHFMENFRRHKPSSKRTANVDGIIGGPTTHRDKAKLTSAQVGNFRQSEGFHATERGRVGTSAAATATPALARQSGRQPNRGTDGKIDLSLPKQGPPLKGRKARKARRKAKKAAWSTRKRVFMRVLKVLLIIIVLISLFLGYKFIRNTSKVFRGNVFGLFQEDKLRGEDKGRVTILLAGNSVDDPGHGGAELTDSIMLISIDTNNHNAYMMSIPRDLWVTYGPKNCSVGYSGKINAAYVCGEETNFHESGYPSGGMGLLAKDIEENFGVDINYYARINYTAFKDAVNAVGGIDVNIQSEDSRGLYDANIAKADGGPLKLTNGVHHLDGQTALNLARARGDTISYGFSQSDFTRTEHQRQMLLALKDKTLSAGVLSNPAKISSLFDAAGNNVETDFKTSEIRRLYTISKTINNSNIQSIGLADKNVNLVQGFSAPNGTSAVRPVAGISDFSQIKAFIKRLTSNDPVAKEGATVAVLNGSGIDGLALKNAGLLADKGITVKATATAGKPRAATTIVVVKGAQKTKTKAYLEQKYKTTATTDVVNNPEAKFYDADFVIILGQNESSSN